tara:strand:- start:54 stop:512 length:459 start_codon:yes stop_codon:yes gene_type:complete
MILISHRGNVDVVNVEKENTKSYIQEAIDLGYDVEIDVRYVDNKFWLGHDKADYEVELEWLIERKNNLWIHCKNFESLSELLQTDLKVFYHLKEDYTIISDKHIWAHNLENINKKCIIPLINKVDILKWKPTPVYGICSDYVGLLNNKGELK